MSGYWRAQGGQEAALQLADDVGVAIDVSTERENTPLWKVIWEIARQVTEIQVVDLETIIRELISRFRARPLKSAIATHRDIFCVTKRGREKFVHLEQ
jgi:hypothetical protein